jgi:hypothetical protein
MKNRETNKTTLNKIFAPGRKKRTGITKDKKPACRYRFIYRPGLTWHDEAIRSLVSQMREVAASCFESIPEYQALTGRREELADIVIAAAWRKDGTMAGFCSTVILRVDGVGDVQHLGLTCVRPEDRSRGLTHILTHKAVAGYLMRHKPVAGRLWISNCAAVLSSLVNVSLHFEEVYPSPSPSARATGTHRAIAEAIDRHYRHKIYINGDASFDSESFVFKNSVKGTVFQKSADETSYFHRNRELNEYYRTRMVFDDGDEVLQVGYATTVAAIRHIFRNIPLPAQRTKPSKRFGATLPA